LSVPIQNRPRSRLEGLSDLVFGLALSIGALNLISSNPAGSSNPTGSLLTGIILFMFSFLVLINVWLRYSDIMTFLPVENRRSRDLNIGLLFLVALEPYLFNQLFGYGLGGFNGVGNPIVQGSFLDVSTTLFALDIGSIYGILALFTNLLAREEKNLVEPGLLGYYKRKRNVEATVAGAFFISALPFFWTPAPILGILRFYFWLAPFFARRVIWLIRRNRS
jgi:uncharacterized membrane protein